MNTLKDMILTEIEGEWYAVPVGEAAKDQDGVVKELMEEYEVDEATARENVRSFADKLTSAGVL